MSLPGIAIGPGISVGGGISIGTGTNTASVTVAPGDLSFNTLIYGGYANWSAAGFDCDGQGFIYNGICYNITQGLHDSFAAILTAAGLTVSDAYAWNVSWNIGGTGLVRLGLNASGNNTLGIAPIDPTDTRWQSGNINSNSLAGTFGFPATFTLYTPAVHLNGAGSWC